MNSAAAPNNENAISSMTRIPLFTPTDAQLTRRLLREREQRTVAHRSRDCNTDAAEHDETCRRSGLPRVGPTAAAPLPVRILGRGVLLGDYAAPKLCRPGCRGTSSARASRRLTHRYINNAFRPEIVHASRAGSRRTRRHVRPPRRSAGRSRRGGRRGSLLFVDRGRMRTRRSLARSSGRSGFSCT